MALETIEDRCNFLRRKTEDVLDFTGSVYSSIEIMKQEILLNDLVSISAPQIGRLLSVLITYINEEFSVFINPEITYQSKDAVPYEEGCGSLPSVYHEVCRPSKVSILALDENGESFHHDYEGFEARVIQHEMDHLKGIIFTDYI